MWRIRSLIHNRNHWRVCGCIAILSSVLICRATIAAGQVSESSPKPDGIDWIWAVRHDGKNGIDIGPLARLAYRNAILSVPDNKVLIAGSTIAGYLLRNHTGLSDWGESEKRKDTATVQRIVLHRFNKDGTADTSFNHTGTKIFGIDSLNDEAITTCIRPDGCILTAARSSRPYLYRQYFTVFCTSPKGRLNHAFGTGGFFALYLDQETTPVDAVLLNDARLLLVTTRQLDHDKLLKIYCLNTKGKLDRAFGQRGVLTDSIREGLRFDGLALLPDGRFRIFCSAAEGLSALNYSNRGIREAEGRASVIEFGKPAYLKMVKQLPDGNLLLLLSVSSGVSYNYRTELRRYLSDNRLDSTFCSQCSIPGCIDFGEQPIADGLHNVYVLPDSSLILAGTPGIGGLGDAEIGANTELFFSRVYQDGIRDTAFGRNGWQRIKDEYYTYGINHIISDGKKVFVLGYMSRGNWQSSSPRLLSFELGRPD